MNAHTPGKDPHSFGYRVKNQFGNHSNMCQIEFARLWELLTKSYPAKKYFGNSYGRV
jgi:hypothetical protein